jgi:plastocyanin
MKKVGALALVLLFTTAACVGGSSRERTILVDHTHDEFSAGFGSNFPRRISVHPGAEVVFRQTWTGEPHTVTGGTLADEMMEEVRPFFDKIDRGEAIPEDPPRKLEELIETNGVWAWETEDDDSFNQTAAQPCYLARGNPPANGKPCDARDQPAFDGRQSYYNSGFIPYEGPQGNEYRVRFADDIKPGSYWFYCNYHGALQASEVVVKPEGERVDSQEEINERTRQAIMRTSKPLRDLYADVARDRRISMTTYGGNRIEVEGAFAGLLDPTIETFMSLNEFIPKSRKVRAGQELSWNIIGGHTISFGVPEYFPILTFERDGTVLRNPKLDPPAGGAKGFDAPDDERFDEERTRPVRFDGGTYDGDGFWSSGNIEADPYLRYTMRISKPGTYRYACLIHPPMVGTIEVTPLGS